MSKETEGQVTPDPKVDEVDPLKQIKGEFNRKLSETNELVKQMLAQQAAFQESFKKPAPKPAVVEEENLDDLVYSNPKEYARIIKEQAKQEALEAIRSESSAQDSVKTTIAGLYNEYPELSDPEGELTKAAAAILKSATDAEKTNPRTYEYAVMKAARELDVKPKSKRPAPADDDGFVAPSYTSPQARSKKRSSEQVVSANKDLAKTFGLDLNDPKNKDRYLNLLKQKGQI